MALMDGCGRVAGFTGAGCEPEAGIACGAGCCSAYADALVASSADA